MKKTYIVILAAILVISTSTIIYLGVTNNTKNEPKQESKTNTSDESNNLKDVEDETKPDETNLPDENTNINEEKTNNTNYNNANNSSTKNTNSSSNNQEVKEPIVNIKYKKPNIEFTNNGNSKLMEQMVVKFNITGNYDPKTLEYNFSNQNGYLPNTNWKKYSNEIKISNITDKVFVWIKVVGLDGKTYYNCSNSFNMVDKYINPVINYTVNGDYKLLDKVNTKLLIEGHYDNTSIYYAIADTNNENLIDSQATKWISYEGQIELKDLNGLKYVWTKVVGLDGKTYYNCSNSFNMIDKYETPEIEFTNNGSEKLLEKATTKLTITGHYDISSIQYMVSNKRDESVLNEENINWISYEEEIELKGLNGYQYIWIKVVGLDGKTYYNCSNRFYMTKQYRVPQIVFSTNGTTTLSENAITSIMLNGDVDFSSVEYMISDTNNEEILENEGNNWIKYNRYVKLQELNGLKYVWAKVVGLDGKIYYNCSKSFNMTERYVKPEITFDPVSNSQNLGFLQVKLNITGDYNEDSIKYVISENGENAPTEGWIRYNLESTINLSIPKSQYIWVKVMGLDGEEVKVVSQEYIIKYIKLDGGMDIYLETEDYGKLCEIVMTNNTLNNQVLKAIDNISINNITYNISFEKDIFAGEYKSLQTYSATEKIFRSDIVDEDVIGDVIYIKFKITTYLGEQIELFTEIPNK